MTDLEIKGQLSSIQAELSSKASPWGVFVASIGAVGVGLGGFALYLSSEFSNVDDKLSAIASDVSIAKTTVEEIKKSVETVTAQMLSAEAKLARYEEGVAILRSKRVDFLSYNWGFELPVDLANAMQRADASTAFYAAEEDFGKFAFISPAVYRKFTSTEQNTFSSLMQEHDWSLQLVDVQNSHSFLRLDDPKIESVCESYYKTASDFLGTKGLVQVGAFSWVICNPIP
ncbi:hypothetical protein [Phaeobacter sp. B1627]|uniref:hypothetical protein n=1 Tax=Phaeobacter sp. B1627 TaxID=2583809 RepID=UPI001119BF75|nr:hypothetical protein [Phaeobacter sp. B1627]TNJ40465.1 hypothetical protein FGE21_17760 [Phaeobacter sp. B1627]